jgi:hypothetical protein
MPLLALLVLIALAPVGRAVPLPDTSTTIRIDQEYYDDNETIHYPDLRQPATSGNTEFNSPLGLPVYAMGQATYSPTLPPMITATASANWDDGSTVVVTSTYYFQITGGAVGTQVPIIISATAAVSQPSGGAENIAQLGLNTPEASYGILDVCAPPVPTPYCGSQNYYVGSFSGSLNEMVTSGDVNSIEMYLVVGAQPATPGFTDMQSGFIDSTIVIDPSFVDANEFSLIFSPGVSDGSATPGSGSLPEPAGTAALLLTGLAALGVTRRFVRS